MAGGPVLGIGSAIGGAVLGFLASMVVSSDAAQSDAETAGILCRGNTAGNTEPGSFFSPTHLPERDLEKRVWPMSNRLAVCTDEVLHALRRVRQTGPESGARRGGARASIGLHRGVRKTSPARYSSVSARRATATLLIELMSACRSRSVDDPDPASARPCVDVIVRHGDRPHVVTTQRGTELHPRASTVG